jgi:chromosome segregation ATPase
MHLLTFPPTLIKRAIDDLGAIGDAARRLPQIESELLRYVDTLTREIVAVRQGVEALKEELRPIQELEQVREGIAPLDGDMRAVRDSVDNLEPLIERMVDRIGALDKRLEGIQADVAPIGELAEKLPGVG